MLQKQFLISNSALIICKDNKNLILAVGNKDNPESLGFPSSIIENGVDAKTTLCKNILENTNVEISPQDLEHVYSGPVTKNNKLYWETTYTIEVPYQDLAEQTKDGLSLQWVDKGELMFNAELHEYVEKVLSEYEEQKERLSIFGKNSDFPKLMLFKDGSVSKILNEILDEDLLFKTDEVA